MVKTLKVIIILLFIITFCEIGYYIYLQVTHSPSKGVTGNTTTDNKKAVPTEIPYILPESQKTSSVCTVASQAKDPLFTTDTLNSISVYLGALQRKFNQKVYMTIQTDGKIDTVLTNPNDQSTYANILNSEGSIIEQVGIPKSPSENEEVYKVVNGKEEPGKYSDIKQGETVRFDQIINVNDFKDVRFKLFYYR
jgi:hypothetical protein